MPEQLDPRSAEAVPIDPHPIGNAKPVDAPSTGWTGEQFPPFLRPTDILEVGPLHREVIAELHWAYEQCQRGAFSAYRGQYLAIVHQTVQAVGDADEARDEAASKTGVPPERVALFYVGGE
jgi:hypothetical protein